MVLYLHFVYKYIYSSIFNLFYLYNANLVKNNDSFFFLMYM